MRINPEYDAVWYRLGIAYGSSGQLGKEIEAYEQAVRIDPEFSVVWHNLGVAYDRSGQSAKAIEAFQRAERINAEKLLI